MNNIEDKSNKYCCGCGACAVVCPHKAIEMIEINGFWFPKINQDKCVSCGLCKLSCAKFVEIKKSNYTQVYAAQNKDKNVLLQASSGGVAYELCKKALEKGYVVIGCEYDAEQHIALHSIARDIKELEKFFGSKYMQSQFWRAIDLRQMQCDEKRYLVIGTPCQNFSLHCVLTRMRIRDRFLLVDFFCHGVPTKLIWDNAVKKIECRYGKIKAVVFRSKKRGWHSFINEVMCGNHKKTIEEKEGFYDLFFSDAVLNKACYQCEIRKTFAYSDIRIGDFWGDKFLSNKDGVSVVCLCNDKGKEFFELVKNNFKLEQTDNDFEKYNALRDNNGYDSKLYDEMIKALKTDDNRRAFGIYIKKLPMSKRIKLRLKKIYEKLPYKMRYFVKAKYYKTQSNK